MVKKILNILNRQSYGVSEAAILLGSFTLLAQILALFRDRALAHFIGPSSTLDIYYAAFRIPDFLYISIGSLVSITVLIPFLLEKMQKKENAGDGGDAYKFLSDMFTVFLWGMIIVSAVVYFLIPKLSTIVAPGFSLVARHDLIIMSRIMLLSPILLGLSNLFGTVTQLYKKFFVFALSPIFYNIGIIFGVVVLYPIWGIYGLAFGVIAGALMHLLIQTPVVVQHHFAPKFSFKIDFKEIKRVIMLSLPRTLALSLNNFSILALLSIASTMNEGSISIFNFSFNLQSVPMAIIGVSYSVAAFPTLARSFGSGDVKSFLDHVISAARQIIFWSLPVIFLFIVLRAQIVRVILGSGSFSWANTRLTAAALALFSLSIVAQSLSLLFVRAYYAAGKTKKPLSVNFIFSILIIALAFMFVKVFNHAPFFRYFMESILRVDDITGTRILMLPLAYSIGTILNFFALWRLFRKDFLKNENVTLQKTFLQSLGASFLIGFVTYIFLGIFGNVFDLNTFKGIFLQGFLSSLFGIGAGVVVLALMKNKELLEVWGAIHKKFWKTEVIAPEQTEL